MDARLHSVHTFWFLFQLVQVLVIILNRSVELPRWKLETELSEFTRFNLSRPLVVLFLQTKLLFVFGRGTGDLAGTSSSEINLITFNLILFSFNLASLGRDFHM